MEKPPQRDHERSFVALSRVVIPIVFAAIGYAFVALLSPISPGGEPTKGMADPVSTAEPTTEPAPIEPEPSARLADNEKPPANSGDEAPEATKPSLPEPTPPPPPSPPATFPKPVTPPKPKGRELPYKDL